MYIISSSHIKALNDIDVLQFQIDDHKVCMPQIRCISFCQERSLLFNWQKCMLRYGQLKHNLVCQVGSILFNTWIYRSRWFQKGADDSSPCCILFGGTCPRCTRYYLIQYITENWTAYDISLAIKEWLNIYIYGCLQIYKSLFPNTCKMLWNKQWFPWERSPHWDSISSYRTEHSGLWVGIGGVNISW